MFAASFDLGSEWFSHKISKHNCKHWFAPDLSPAARKSKEGTSRKLFFPRKILGAFAIRPKIPEISEQERMVQKFPGKVSRKTGKYWALSIRPKIPEISEQGRMVQNLLGKFPENPERVDFPKCEPFNRKPRKFQKQNQMELKVPETVFENLGLPCEVVLFSGNFGKSYHFTLSLSSFGRKFSDLCMQLKAATCVKEAFLKLGWTRLFFVVVL